MITIRWRGFDPQGRLEARRHDHSTTETGKKFGPTITQMGLGYTKASGAQELQHLFRLRLFR